MKRIHYGWVVCLGCALLLFCTSGLSINAFTVYQPYIIQQNGFTNAQASFIITVRSLFAFLSMFLTGTYYKRLSLRFGMTLAGILTASSFILFVFAKTHAMYCLAAMVLGFGYGFGTMIPIAIVLEHWFIQKRTFAISLCSAITGLSTLGFPSILTWMIETYGLQFAFLAEGTVIAVLSFLTFIFVRDMPAEKGVQPYGAGVSEETHQHIRHSRTLQAKNWYILVPMLLLIGAMTNVGYSHLAVLISSEGFNSHLTALAITVSGVTMTVSKCTYGWVSERLGTYRSNWIFGTILMIGMILCCITNGNPVILFTAMCTYGAGLALTTVGLTAWAGDLSSPEQYDNTVRRFQLGYAAGGLIFSSLPGILADRFHGSYIPAYIFFTVCTLFVVCSIQWTYSHTITHKE